MMMMMTMIMMMIMMMMIYDDGDGDLVQNNPKGMVHTFKHWWPVASGSGLFCQYTYLMILLY